MVRKKVKK